MSTKDEEFTNKALFDVDFENPSISTKKTQFIINKASKEPK